MIYSKTIEMFAEAIPAGILQAYAFARSSNRTTSAFVSILISAVTTGFGSALISYGESLKGGKIVGHRVFFSLFLALSTTLQIMTPRHRGDD